MTKVGNM